MLRLTFQEPLYNLKHKGHCNRAIAVGQSSALVFFAVEKVVGKGAKNVPAVFSLIKIHSVFTLIDFGDINVERVLTIDVEDSLHDVPSAVQPFTSE